MKRNTVSELSLHGFAEYCKQNGFYRFIFSDENQCDDIRDRCMMYTITFYHVKVISNECKVIFYNNNIDDVMYKQCYISLDIVKRVTVEEIDSSCFFCEITFFCEEDVTTGDVREYKFIAQKKI